MKRFTLMLAGVLCASASFATDYYVSVEGSGEKMALLGKMPLALPICVVKSMSIKMEMFLFSGRNVCSFRCNRYNKRLHFYWRLSLYNDRYES